MFTVEIRNGARYGEVVQFPKRVRIYSAFSGVERAGLNSLNEGQVIEYEEVANTEERRQKI